MNMTNEIISFNATDNNRLALVNLARLVYENRLKEMELPTEFIKYFNKSIKTKSTPQIMRMLLGNDDAPFRDMVTRDIILGLLEGVKNLPHLDKIYDTEEFWEVVYMHFNLNEYTDTITEYDILLKYGNSFDEMEKQMNTPCNALVTDIVKHFYRIIK